MKNKKVLLKLIGIVLMLFAMIGIDKVTVKAGYPEDIYCVLYKIEYDGSETVVLNTDQMRAREYCELEQGERYVVRYGPKSKVSGTSMAGDKLLDREEIELGSSEFMRLERFTVIGDVDSKEYEMPIGLTYSEEARAEGYPDREVFGCYYKIVEGKESMPMSPDTSKSGMCIAANGCWNYFKDGVVDRSFSGMACNEYGWWKITDGELDLSYTGMACNEYGWWMLKNGVVDLSYTGMACNEYGWWMLKNGVVDFSYNGMACNEYGWWMLKDGTVDFSYNGMGCNEYGWWMLKNGMVDLSYNGYAKNEYGLWKIANGSVDFGYNGSVSIIDYTGPGEPTNRDAEVVNGLVIFK